MTAIVEIRKNPMSLLFLVLLAPVFGVAQLTDPENVRFLAFDAAELPQRWYAILAGGLSLSSC